MVGGQFRCGYWVGITAVDPSRLDLLFERFISAERNEPPDIDIDFEQSGAKKSFSIFTKNTGVNAPALRQR